MNSEELELSLRNEFESYLKNIFAEMRQEVSDFQDKFQTEFEKHKSQLDDVFKDFSARIENDRELDAAFKDSVVEHLRLSRDEGARITASAIAEAEDLDKQNFAASASASTVGFSAIRDAISDISSQDSQSAILKSLVNHAAQFTARGAFFIIKNEHFVGWRVFGNEAEMDEEIVREIFFPMANETLLSESVRSLSAVESSYGTYADDSLYLNKLEFGQPEKMYAVPLVARGRGVAVLYADYGTQESAKVNVEAIETLVRVAGLTVELLAASQIPKPPAKDETQNTHSAPETAENTQVETISSYQAVGGYGYSQPQETEQKTVEETPQENTQEFVAEDNFKGNPYAEFEESATEPETATDSEEFEYKAVEDDVQPEIHEVEEVSAQIEEDPESARGYKFVSEQETEETAKTTEPEEKKAEPAYSWSQPTNSFESYKEPATEMQEEEKTFAATEISSKETNDFATIPAAEYTFESTQNYNSESANFESTSSFSSEPVSFEDAAPIAETPQSNQWESNSFQEQTYNSSRFETAETPAETQFESFTAAVPPVETVSETISAPPVKPRFSERNVDLPIEVPEDERRSHNDARRFARLLVSEIKLYNEQKVKEGRDGNNLYDRLREAIDRSREMYDKRVQPPVASKFDYFHYELVSNLAEGDTNKLGANYPGASF